MATLQNFMKALNGKIERLTLQNCKGTTYLIFTATMFKGRKGH